MKKCFLIFAISYFLSACAQLQKTDQHHSKLEIIEIDPSKWTALVKQNILHLGQVYDLEPFLFTQQIKIDRQENSHNRPVLTINTKNAEIPHFLFAQLLHEEFHWWLNLNKVKTELSVKDLKKSYGVVPKNYKEKKHEAYQHIIVCYLEFKALSFFLGQKEALGVMTKIIKKEKILSWVYREVLINGKKIEKILEKNNLLPLVLKSNKKTTTL